MKRMNKYEESPSNKGSMKSRLLNAICRKLKDATDDPRGCWVGMAYEPEFPPELLEKMVFSSKK